MHISDVHHELKESDITKKKNSLVHKADTGKDEDQDEGAEDIHIKLSWSTVKLELGSHF